MLTTILRFNKFILSLYKQFKNTWNNPYLVQLVLTNNFWLIYTGFMNNKSALPWTALILSIFLVKEWVLEPSFYHLHWKYPWKLCFVKNRNLKQWQFLYVKYDSCRLYLPRSLPNDQVGICCFYLIFNNGNYQRNWHTWFYYNNFNLSMHFDASYTIVSLFKLVL